MMPYQQHFEKSRYKKQNMGDDISVSIEKAEDKQKKFPQK